MFSCFDRKVKKTPVRFFSVFIQQSGAYFQYCLNDFLILVRHIFFYFDRKRRRELHFDRKRILYLTYINYPSLT